MWYFFKWFSTVGNLLLVSESDFYFCSCSTFPHCYLHSVNFLRLANIRIFPSFRRVSVAWYFIAHSFTCFIVYFQQRKATKQKKLEKFLKQKREIEDLKKALQKLEQQHKKATMAAAKECEQTSQSLAGQPHGGDLLDGAGNCKGCGYPPVQHETQGTKDTKNRRAGRRPKSASRTLPSLLSSFWESAFSSPSADTSSTSPLGETSSKPGATSSSALSEERLPLKSQFGSTTTETNLRHRDVQAH